MVFSFLHNNSNIPHKQNHTAGQHKGAHMPHHVLLQRAAHGSPTAAAVAAAACTSGRRLG